MKLMTVLGARPQFIKAAVVSRAFRSAAGGGEPIRELIVHTGQHYDANMSQVFFDEMDIPRPTHSLNIGSGSHGAQTGAMLAAIEKVALEEKPDWVLVYGDTNSTLAGALVAAKLHIPVAHVEAGLRSFNRRMPEEINRIMTDHVSTVLFCPTQTAVDNLLHEGLPTSRLPKVQVVYCGDVMYDAALFYGERAPVLASVAGLSLKPKEFILATIHRAETTDDAATLAGVVELLTKIGSEFAPVVWPIHPRTRHLLEKRGDLSRLLEHDGGRLKLIDPVGYLEMVALEKAARLIVTDSGGVQKEAYFHHTPCVTLRTETEWVELVEAGWNQVVGTDQTKVMRAVQVAWNENWLKKSRPELYGKGNAGELIARWLKNHRA